MKWKCSLGAGLLAVLAAGFVAAAEPDNAVGFVRVPLLPRFNLLAWNWQSIPDGSNAISVQDLFDTSALQQYQSLYLADRLMLWDRAQQRYKVLWLYGNDAYPSWDGKWIDERGDIATNQITRGEAFWYQRIGVATSVTLTGVVPEDASFTHAPFRTNGARYNLFGSAYAADFVFNSSNDTLRLTGRQGWDFSTSDNVLLWDASLQRYKLLWLYDALPSYSSWDGRWIADGFLMATDQLSVAHGAWYKRSGATNLIWNQAKPYSYPD